MKKPTGKKRSHLLISAPNPIFSNGIKALLGSDDYIFSEHIGKFDELMQLPVSEFDLLLIDADTPESLRISTIKYLRKKYPNAKIIALNVLHHLPYRIEQFMKAGVNGCVSKHAPAIQFTEVIKEVQHGKRYLCNLCAQALMDSIVETNMHELTELTEKERKIIICLANDYYNHEIADELGMSLRTVETHRKNIMRKLNVQTLAGITRYAMKKGLL